ncbi:MAG: MBL fold metallo-hydrolase RNA specificity domain-containing protein [Chloroflexota bacterium]|nr:MBL fold metallo-hydrolase RNA specificity domain-containing protein [Chloroflexota bacterium]
MAVRITVYGGARQVGGNQVLVEDGPARWLFDFGIPFHQWGKFYEEYLQPRKAFGLLDFLTMGLVPPVKGLYRPDLEHPLVGQVFPDRPTVEVQGVLLSHAHLDHSGYISLLHPDIPVYATLTTAVLAKAIQDTSRGDIEREVVYYTPQAPKRDDLLTNDPDASAVQRQFVVPADAPLTDAARRFWGQSLWARKSMKHTTLQTASALDKKHAVRCWPVDHSVPGACAWAVETSAGWVAYTGDIRRHGARAQDTQRFLDDLAQLRPRVLLCEGTRAPPGSRPSFTESDVAQRAREHLKSVQGGLVFADFGPRNVERLLIFHALARDLGRQLVIFPKDAYLLDALRTLDPSLPAPGPETGIRLYAEPKIRQDAWEQDIRQRYESALVTPKDVHQNQEAFILCFSLLDLNDLPTLRPRPGSLYLYSSHEAFDEESGLDFDRLLNWLQHFQMRPVGVPQRGRATGLWLIPPEEEGLHASGHASGSDLVDMVRQVRPRTLLLVHAQPEAYDYFVEHLSGTGIEVLMPRHGHTLEFA